MLVEACKLAVLLRSSGSEAAADVCSTAVSEMVADGGADDLPWLLPCCPGIVSEC